VDHFGNLTTNLLLKYGLSGRVEIGGEPIPGFSLTFSDVGEGKLLAYRGSSGLLEIALRNGNAKEALNKGEGVNVVLEITTGA
jgi:S-adenosylmethionine hydrolase